MAGFYGIFLIIALVLVSGVIAYVGDIVGRRMGRKRLSLFGLRPRHTAIVISVVSGMLITIFTLGAALAINENVRVGFLSVDRLRAELKQLRPEHGRLKRETETLTARTQELEQQRAAADAEIAKQHTELEKTKQTLEQARADLKREQGNLSKTEQKVKTVSAVVVRKEEEVRTLRAESRRLQARVRDVQLMAGAALFQERRTPPVLEAGQPLDMMLIEPGLTLPQIRKQLDGAVARVDQAVRGVGARPGPDSKQAVVIWHSFVHDPKTGKSSWVPADLVLNGLAREIRENKDPKGVVVRVICLMNTPEGEPVPVDFEIFRNNLVFAKGAKLGEVVVGEGLAEAEIYDALVLLLREQVGPRGRGRVMPLMKPGSLPSYSRGREHVGDIGSRDLFAAVEKIKQIRGRSHVTAVAKEDVWTIGPLRVELEVEPI